MQCMVDPARQTILIITFNVTRHGTAWHGERANHEKGYLHQRRQASLRPKAVLSFSMWISCESEVPLKVRYSSFSALLGWDTNTG
jgi:hypothetical protein